MDRFAEATPCGTDPDADRLIYLTHQDIATCKALALELVGQGFHVSLLPDMSALARLVLLRRPDLVLLPLCEGADTLTTLDAIHGQHLGIHAFLLAPEGVRAEPVVEAMRHGATAVFSPPYAPAAIAAEMQQALGGDIRLGTHGAAAVTLRGFGTLTYRERQILQFVVEGCTNREIAGDLGLSYRTVEVHRRHIMKKTGARNTAELVRLAVLH